MVAYLLMSWLNRGIVEDFEIQPGRRWSKDTLLEMPDMSYAQELLSTPVPVENRIAVLNNTNPTFTSHTFRTIANSLNVSVKTAETLAAEIDIIPDKDTLPLYSFELLEEEVLWNRFVDTLPQQMGPRRVGNAISRDRDWVIQTANELAIFPAIDVAPNGLLRTRYDKSLVSALRTLMLHAPLASDWQNAEEFSREFRRSERWVVNILERNGIFPQDRMANKGQNVSPHYHPDSREVLRENNSYEMAGDWMTISRMATLLARGYNWVQIRIQKSGIVGEMRFDDTHKLARHYSPEIFEQLKHMREAEKTSVELEGYISEKELARRLGRTWKWVRSRSDKIDSIVVTYVDTQDRTMWLYPEEAEAQMNELPSRRSKKPIL